MQRKVLLGFLGHLLCRGLLELDGLLHGNLIRFNILMPDAARNLLDLAGNVVFSDVVRSWF